MIRKLEWLVPAGVHDHAALHRKEEMGAEEVICADDDEKETKVERVWK